MKKEKIFLALFCIILPLFLLLLSYQLTMAGYPLTPAQENTFQFLNGKEKLALNYTATEISHLEDVALVMKRADLFFYINAGLILALLFYLRKEGEQPQKLLKYGGISTVTFVLIILLALLLNFNSFFTLFHQLFFPQGNWQFAADSLLIQTFPLEFFVKVSATIFIVALLLGSLFILLSVYRKHGHTNRGN